MSQAKELEATGPRTRSVRSHFAIINRPSGGIVVVDPGDGSRRLPWADDWNEELWFLRPDSPPPAGIGDGGAATLGFDLPPLTMLTSWAKAEETAGEDERVDVLYLCEPALGHDTSAARFGSWSPGEPAPDALPQHLVAALETAAWLNAEPNSSQDPPPWPVFNRPGFTELLGEELDGDPAACRFAGLSVPNTADTRDLRQLRGWCLSSVWLNDEVVLKVTLPLWPLEPLLTSWLSTRAPELVPPVLASGVLSSAGGQTAPWFLQRRATAPLNVEAEGTDPDERLRRSRLAVAKALARIQGIAATSRSELDRMGVEDRSPQHTATELSLLWKAEDLQRLAPEETGRLPLLDAWLRARLADMEKLGGPALLSHGDLHLGNVIANGVVGLAIIDWTDAALAWPGVDLLTLLRFETKPSAARDELVEAYSSALAESLGLGAARVGELTTVGLSLAPVYHALSYARIERALPTALRWHFAGTISEMVRTMLADMSNGP